VGQSPAGKNMNIVGMRYQAMTGEEIADLEDLVRAVVYCRVCKLAIAL
jgi:hypothetical protein